MSVFDNIKRHTGAVYRRGMALPDPEYETSSGRGLYSQAIVERLISDAVKHEREQVANWLESHATLVDCDCGCNSRKAADAVSAAFLRAAAACRLRD